MQLIWKCPFTDEDYVSGRAWENATLANCPFHPDGGCGLQKLGTYERVEPAGAEVPRWWCPTQGESISLLPSFFAARIRGTLDAIEDVVVKVEAAKSLTEAVDVIHPPDAPDAIELAGALRSVRRRVSWVKAILTTIVTLFADRFGGTQPTLASFRQQLGTSHVLLTLRDLCSEHLGALAPPFGLRARARV